MIATWNWPGSRWWRVDLHAHSPASHDFGDERDRATPDWDRWIEVTRDAGIHAVAISDHNTARGIDSAKKAASGSNRGPVVFPSLELTACDGTHLILVLDPGCDQQHVEDLLSRARVPVDQRGTREARSSLSVEQILGLEHDGGVIFLGAHVNGPAGLLEHNGQQRLQELRHPSLAGVEVDPSRLLDVSWLDGSRAEIERVLPQLWSSDSHGFGEVGRRFTWVKMTKPDAEGLRLALLDGSGSLQPAAKDNPGDPNKHSAYLLESITVRQAKYMGRPNALTVKFNPWLSSIIGGRGTGKSTLIDLCRTTMHRENELPAGGETSLRAAYDKRMQVPASRTDEGLLTPDTAVEVVYRKDGQRFILSWDKKGAVAPIQRVEGDERVAEEGEVRERFPVRIYSQKQLFELAKDPNALFAVIDDTTEVRGGEISRACREAESKYLSLCAEARSLRAQGAELSARLVALEDVRRKIEVLQQGGHAHSFKDYRTRRKQDAAWKSIENAAAEGLEVLSGAAKRLVVADLDKTDVAADDPGVVALNRTHELVRSVVDELRITVLDAAARARLQIETTVGESLVAWRQAVASSEKQYRVVSEQLRNAGIANPDSYRDLLEQAASLENEIGALKSLRGDAEDCERRAADELGRYRDRRAALTGRRKAFAGSSSNQLIQVEVHPYAARSDIEPFLREILGIARFEEDYRTVVDRIVSAPVAQTEWGFGGLDAVVAELRRVLSDPHRSWPAKDRRFESALRKVQPERIDRLALYLPEDAIEVSFRDPREPNGQKKRLSQGSPGQQTAALLAFVLGFGDEPLLLDQPEDDLDSTLITELLVRRIRDTKQSRQIIVVTHNSNIVVHGDAELVISLDTAGGQTKTRFSGGLQERGARDEVCRVMEGGRDAFDARYRRITQSRAKKNA